MLAKSLYTLAILSILSLLSLNCFSQNNSSQSSTYNLKVLKDIPQNDVNCIFKDRKGFMWIGTLDGLFRFDGYEYKEYRVDDREDGPSSNLIIDIDEDSYDNIWIATFDKGLCKFNPETEIFTHYHNSPSNPNLFNSNDISCLLVDDQNVIWTGNWFGVNRIRFSADMNEIVEVATFHPIKQDTHRSDNDIRYFHQDKNKNIWIGTNSNLYLCENPYENTSSLTFEQYPVVSIVIQDSESGIIVGGDRIVELTPKTKKIGKRFVLNEIAQVQTRALHYSNRTIWAGDREGIYTYKETQRGVWKPGNHYFNNFSNISLSSNIIYCITPDNYGQIWVGTRGGGINIFNPNHKKFENYNHTTDPGSIANDLCRSVYEDSQQNLWIGTEEGGVSVLPYSHKTNYSNGFKHFSVNESILANRAYAIKETHHPKSKKHKNIIWLGTGSPTHLRAVDVNTLQFINLPELVDDLGFVFAIESQNDSTLWMGTYGRGLIKISLNEEGEIIRHKRFLPQKDNVYSLSSHIIRSILKDHKGNLWIGTDKGLNRLSKEEINNPNPKFEVFTKGDGPSQLNHDYILQIFEARNGKIWIGTMGGGLLSYEESAGTQPDFFSKVTVEEGLPNNSIKSIVEDDKGNLWLASNKGLSRYNPQKGEIVNYDASDGLQDNEFAEISACKRQNGQLVFGGLKGFNVFYPQDIVSDTIKPRMFLTDFYLYNKEVKTGQEVNGKVILEKALSHTQSLNLKYKENSFSIGFVALHYNAPQKNNYRYKLEGFDEQWYSANANHRIARYTNIPSGEYTFKVMGSNSDNSWSSQPASLNLVIEPPFLMSNFAIVLYLIALIIIIYIQQRISKTIEKRKNETLIAIMEKQKVEDMSKMKLQFFTNISHEFRTPLTLINAPLDKLIKNNDIYTAEQRNKNQQLIKQNVNVMMRLINQLMDFRRLDQNKMKLLAHQYNLVDFVKAIHQSFDAIAEQKNIDFNFLCERESVEVWFDPYKLEKVIYNLLSNAFKFTPNGGEIEIGINEKTEKNRVVIYVKDSGLGIDQDESQHIFERYFQTYKKHKNVAGGSGIGLAISKGLVDLHKGSIRFENNPDKGTTFFVELQLGTQHLLPEEIGEVKKSFEISGSSGYQRIRIDSPETEAEKSATGTERKKVLIVEDNFDLRQFLVASFKEEYEVFDAEDGVAGLEQCKEVGPDIVISDVMMPRMDGIELCKEIKTDEATSHILVILLTAKDSVEAQIEGFETGADSYLTKPFDSDLLKARVVALIKNREQLRLKFQKDIKINPTVIANNTTDSKFIDKIIKIVEEHLSDSEFSVEQLAEKYGVSRIYLNRKIKGLTGETAIQFIRNIRLKHAAQLLQQGQMTVSEVTWEVGYNDLKTFRGRFKEKFGMSPSEYIKQVKNT